MRFIYYLYVSRVILDDLNLAIGWSKTGFSKLLIKNTEMKKIASFNRISGMCLAKLIIFFFLHCQVYAYHTRFIPKCQLKR